MKTTRFILPALLACLLFWAGCGDDGPTEVVETPPPIVEADGSGDFATITEAVAAAEEGDTIELGDGTFSGDGNRDINYLGKEIVIRSRSGNPEDCIIDCEASLSDPHRGFLITGGVGPEAVLEGVTVINGVECANCDEFTVAKVNLHDLSGAGIKIQGASPTVRNCVVMNCQTEFTGGGISIEIDSSPIVMDCVFSGNSATQQGGGITLEFSSEPVIRNCVIKGNTAQRGGGVAVTQESNGTFDGCVITGNVAIEGAGFYASGSRPILKSVTLSGNRANALGGGISSLAGAGPDVTQSVVWGNCSLTGGDNLYVDGLSDLTFGCCNVDSSEASGSGQAAFEDCIFSDPLFCDPVSCTLAPTEEGHYAVDSRSPCRPDVSPCGLLIGALSEPCEPGFGFTPGLFGSRRNVTGR